MLSQIIVAVVFLSFVTVHECGAVSPSNFVCKDFDRDLYSGKLGIIEVPSPPWDESRVFEILEYFAYERQEAYAMQMLEKKKKLFNAYRKCPTTTVFDGETYQNICKGLMADTRSFTIDGIPRLLVLDPICVHPTDLRPETLKRFEKVIPVERAYLPAVTEMLDRYSLEYDAEEIANIVKESAAFVIELPVGASWTIYWSRLDKAGKLLASLPLRERLTYIKYSALYRKYAEDLIRVRAAAKIWLEKILSLGCTGQYDALESELQYIRLRELRPRRTLEMSCRCGWSTFWLLSALHDNYNDGSRPRGPVPELWSYDIVADVLSLPLPRHLKPFWKFTAGDARETVMMIGDSSGPPQFDYFFIDSDHSETFARDYVDHLLDRQKGQFLSGSIHDVYPHRLSGNWRPSPEGAVVLEWLALLPGVRSSQAFTVSLATAHGLHYALIKLRSELGIAPLGVLDDITRLQGHSKIGKFQLDQKSIQINSNPTLFFDLQRTSEMTALLQE